MVSQYEVIPAQAGIQDIWKVRKKVDSRLHGDDRFSRTVSYGVRTEDFL